MYFAGPDDDVARITAQLERAVGPGNFTYVLGSALMEFAEDEHGEEEGDDDDVDDDDVEQGSGNTRSAR